MPANELGAAGVRHIAGALAHNTTLTELDLAQNALGAAGAAHVADALRENATLRSIGLAHNELGADALAPLADAVAARSTRTGLSVDVTDNAVGDAGAQHLARMAASRGLRDLCAGSCSLSAAGVAALAQSCRLLHRLDLPHNPFGAAGVQCLVDALLAGAERADGVALRSLSLRAVAMGDDGARHVARLLAADVPLVALDVGDNRVGGAGAQAIAAALAVNSRLRRADLSAMRFDERAESRLVQALAHSNTALTDLRFVPGDMSAEAGRCATRLSYANEQELSARRDAGTALVACWVRARRRGATIAPLASLPRELVSHIVACMSRAAKLELLDGFGVACMSRAAKLERLDELAHRDKRVRA